MGGQMQYCGLMALSTPVWVGTAAKLGWRMLTRPTRYFRTVDRSAAAFPDPLPDMQHLLVDNAGVRLHAATHGLGSGKPLMLFIHGFPETWTCWRHQLQEFAGQYELVAMDMRGYGGSDAPKGSKQYTIDKLCSDVAAVLAAVGHTKCTLVAHDWGGTVAWNTAVLYPQMVEKLVVICSAHPAAYRDPERFDAKQLQRSWYMLLFQSRRLGEAFMRHDDYCELGKVFLESPLGPRTPGAFSQQDVERIKAAFARPGCLAASLAYFRAAMKTGTKWDLPAAEKVFHTTITAPTLLMYGDEDHAILPQMFQTTERLVDNLTSFQLQDCSHWAPEDKPEQVNAHMHAFLAASAGSGKAAVTAGSRPGTGATGAGNVIAVQAGPASVSRSATPRQVVAQAGSAPGSRAATPRPVPKAE